MRPSRDIEMATFRPKEDSWAQGSVLSARGAGGSHDDGDDDADHHDHDGLGGVGGKKQQRKHPSATNSFRNFVDSFRRDPGRRFTPASVINPVKPSLRRPGDVGVDGVAGGGGDDGERRGGSAAAVRTHQGGHYFDIHAANMNTANTLLSRELKGRHLQMIAIGGSIGRYICWSSEWVGVVLYGKAANENWKRNGVVCGIRKGAQHGWPGRAHDCVRLRRRHAVLHHPGARRACRDVSRCWVFLGVLDAVSGSGVGIRYGLEVSCL